MMASLVSPNSIHTEVSYKELWPTIVNTFKAFIGSNYLSISYSFKESGYIAGPSILLLVAIATEHCCNLLVKCKKQVYEENLEESDVHSKLDHVHYSDVGYYISKTKGKFIVSASLLVTQYGFCINYIIFLSNTTNEVVYDLNIMSKEEFNAVTTWLPVVAIMGLSTIRNPNSLGWTSMFSSISLLIGAVAISSSTVIKWFNGAPISNDIVPVKWSSIPVTFGMLVSAFEGIGTILPIENSMKVEHEHYFPKILKRVLQVVPSFLGSFAMLHYLMYGESTPQIILSELKASDLGILVRSTLIFGILFGVPLQLLPIFEIMEDWLQERQNFVQYRSVETDMETHQNHPSFIRWAYFFRCLIVISIGIVATISRNYFAYVGALVGSTGGVLLAFILPAYFDISLNRTNLSRIGLFKNYALIAMGILGGLSGLISTIGEIVEKVHGEKA